MKSLLLAAGLLLALAGCGDGAPTGGPPRRLGILSVGTLTTGAGTTDDKAPNGTAAPPATLPPGGTDEGAGEAAGATRTPGAN